MINKYTVTEFLLTFNEKHAVFYNYKQCRTDLKTTDTQHHITKSMRIVIMTG